MLCRSIKRDKRREPFDREKLSRGIEHALEKRAVSTNTVDQLVNEIEEEVYTKGKLARELPTAEIGEIVLKRLNSIDKVAYIRFASVYKHFNDLDEFIKEVKKIGGQENAEEK